MDVGLVEVDDVTRWTSQAFGIGPIGPLADVSESNLSLRLIDAELIAHGGVSGRLEGNIKALFYRFQEIHHQVMRNIEATQRQHVLVVGPLTFYQANIKSFFLEKAFLDCCENGRFTGQPNVANAHSVGSRRLRGGVLIAPSKGKPR